MYIPEVLLYSYLQRGVNYNRNCHNTVDENMTNIIIPQRAEICLHKPRDLKSFRQFEVIINVIVSSCCVI